MKMCFEKTFEVIIGRKRVITQSLTIATAIKYSTLFLFFLPYRILKSKNNEKTTMSFMKTTFCSGSTVNN